jgi:hypothetical protein
MKHFASLHAIVGLNSSLENDLGSIITYVSVACLVSLTSIPLQTSFVVFAIGFYTRLCISLGYFMSKAIMAIMSDMITLRRFQVDLIKTF